MNRILNSAVLLGITEIDNVREFANLAGKLSDKDAIIYGAAEITRTTDAQLTALIQQIVGGQ
jgi:hypothetical protein